MNSENPIFRSLALIEERIQEKLTVENLAASIHLSKFHYQRMFREAVGDSVMHYVTRRRLTLAAKELAADKEITVLELALKYGYDTHEGFTRSFQAYMGVNPTEYRKYHCIVSSPTMQKERCAMMYSKTTDEMIRELNALIVQAKETADYTRKSKTEASPGVSGYAPYWKNIADKTDAMAESLGEILKRITTIASQPDGITARFIIIKTIEDAAFWFRVMAFETGLTVSRAAPAHRAVFMPICEQYDRLAENACIKAGKIAEFFHELSTLIFQDMRKNAADLIGKTVEKGRAAVKTLTADSESPFAYIAEEISDVMNELSAMPLEEITICLLGDYLFRINIAAFAADADTLRSPSHKALLDGISEIREQLGVTIEFFRNLSCDMFQKQDRNAPSHFCLQGNMLLFYLKGEIQKLGNTHLGRQKQNTFDTICEKLSAAVHLAGSPSGESDTAKIKEGIREVYDAIIAECEALGECGEPLKYIANAINQMG